MERKQAKILGYNVDLFSFKDALTYIEEKMDNSVGAQVVTINPEMIAFGNNNPELENILKTADLIVPDGIGIKIALKINGIKQEQIPGIEFAKEVIGVCQQKGYPIALIGAKEDTLIKASDNLINDYPNLNIAYKHDGFFDENEENEILDELVNIQPKIVLVALGVPKQEYVIKRFRNKLDKTIFIGVGGSFDVWSGEIQRAPIAFRKVGCEWLYRLLKQPSRFKRMFPTLPLFLLKVIMEKMKCPFCSKD